MLSRWCTVQAIDKNVVASAAPICIRLGSLAVVFKAQCALQGVSVNEEIRDFITRILVKPDAYLLKVSDEDERIRVGLGSLKPEFMRWCKNQGFTASMALRTLIAQQIAHKFLNSEQAQGLNPGQQEAPISASNSDQVQMGVQELAHEPSRMRLRLKPSEIEAIGQLAVQRRVSPQRLATQILRAFLLKSSVFSQQETVDMGAVNLSLMRIGSNLNQIAKQLNAHAVSQSRLGDSRPADFDAVHLEIRQCVAQLDSHVKTCAHALELSRERWRIELKD